MVARRHVPSALAAVALAVPRVILSGGYLRIEAKSSNARCAREVGKSISKPLSTSNGVRGDYFDACGVISPATSEQNHADSCADSSSP